MFSLFSFLPNLIFSLFWALPSFANIKPLSKIEQKHALAKIYASYKMGNYHKTIHDLKPYLSDPELGPTLYYLQAICHTRLQSFNPAVESFDQAIRAGHKSKDLQYEYGQALYALELYPDSKKAFAASIKARHMIDSSLYYLGYINEKMNQKTKAKRYYKKMLSFKGTRSELKQSAHLGMARLLLAQAEATQRPEVYVEKYVISELEDGIEINPKSSVSPELLKMKSEVMKKYDLLGYRMKNGRLLPRKQYSAKITQSTQYDTNVVSESDETTRQALEKSSWYSKTEVKGDYFFPWQGQLVLTPSLRAYDQRYLDRDHSNIYSNDVDSITPKLELSWDHTLFSKAATAYVFSEYNYTTKDYSGVKKNKYFADSWTFGIGEKFNFFDFGRSSLEIKIKDYQNYAPSASADTTTLLATQSISLPWEHLVVAMFNLDFVRYSDSQKDNDIYLTRVDYIWQDIYWGMILNPALAITFTDTKEQSSTRGTEVTYNPSIKLSKSFIKDHLELECEWGFTQTTSDDEANYEYDKHTAGLNISIKL